MISVSVMHNIFSNICYFSHICKSRDSSDGMETGYGFDGQGLIPARTFLHSIQTGSGANLDSCPVGTRGSFPWVKQPEREADHSPPSSAEVKNDGAIPPLPHISSSHGV
jgi:hypothetical protein